MSTGHEQPPDPDLRRLRLVAVLVVLGLIVLYVLASVVGPPFGRDSFEVDAGVFGTMIGALLVLLGLLAAPRWPGK